MGILPIRNLMVLMSQRHSAWLKKCGSQPTKEGRLRYCNFLNSYRYTNMEEAIQFAKDFIEKYPEHKEEVDSFLQLMEDELEDECASEEHEKDLFIGACEDLLIED